MHRDDMNRDEQWEDLVRRLGGTPEQAKAEPVSEEPVDSDAPYPESEAPRFTGMGPRDYTLAEEEIDDFQPPEPKPVSTGNPRTILSWLGVFGAIFLWVLAGIGGWQLPWWLGIASTAGFLAGGISLFFLLPKTWAHRDPYDDDDFGGGAKV